MVAATSLSIVGWAGARALLSRLTARLPLPAGRREQLELYVLSTCNAGISSLFALRKVRQGWSGPESAAGTLELLCAMYAYLAHDLWATRATWLKQPSFVVHHLLGFVIMQIPFHQAANGLWARATPYFLLMELSTLPLNASWIAREVGLPRLAAVASAAFAASFIALRVVGLPLYLASLRARFPRTWAALGLRGRSALYGVAALQLYWAAKIARGVQRGTI